VHSTFFTQAPAPKFAIQQKLSYASNQEITSTTTLDTGAIANSGLSAKITYRHHQMDGYLRNTLTLVGEQPGSGQYRRRFRRLALSAGGQFSRPITNRLA